MLLLVLWIEMLQKDRHHSGHYAILTHGGEALVYCFMNKITIPAFFIQLLTTVSISGSSSFLLASHKSVSFDMAIIETLDRRFPPSSSRHKTSAWKSAWLKSKLGAAILIAFNTWFANYYWPRLSIFFQRLWIQCYGCGLCLWTLFLAQYFGYAPTCADSTGRCPFPKGETLLIS